MSSGITVVVCAVGKTRTTMLQRAVNSILTQTLQPDAIVVSIDSDRQGAAITRQRGTDMVQTEFVAFLDDDDEFKPQHLHELHWWIREWGCDLVYPWFDVIGGSDPFPMHEGQEWDNDNPRQFPVTYLARTEAIRKAGGWATVPADGPTHADGNRMGEDWRLELNLIRTGAVIKHLNIRSWNWHHTGLNSSGLPSRIQWVD